MDRPSITQDYELLPIDRLKESKTNPRQVFNGIEELAETIRRHGVIVPLLVRPNGEGFEVVAGARRLRAARKAGLKEIAANVRELTDEQVLELQLIENVQRAGIHPLEEARGYQALIERAHLTQEQIAERIGRDQSHIAKRLALLRLTKPANEALAGGKLSTSQAVMIARLQPNDQKQALEMIFDRWRGSMTTRQLAEWIEREVHVQLRGAPFDLKDQGLLLCAGACQACPKRTGSAPELYNDVKRGDTCTDPACYARKIEAHIQSTVRSLEASAKRFLRISTEYFSQFRNKKRLPGVLYRDDYRDIEPATSACQAALPAVVVHGRDNLGHVVTVCASKACRQHFAPARMAQQTAADRKRKLAAQINAEVKRRALAAVLEKIRAPLSAPDLRLVVTAWFEAAGHERRMALCRQERIDPVIVEAQGGHKDYHKGFQAHITRLDAAGLHRLLLALALIGNLIFDHTGSGIEKTAAQRGVDVAGIRARVTAELSGGAK